MKTRCHLQAKALAIVVLFFVHTCFSQSLSTLSGIQYSSKTNTTDYTVLPLGTVYLPGKWEKEKYNPVSGQQWFFDQDSIPVAIALTPCNKFEFSKKSLKGFAFVRAYYEWDSKYLAETNNLSRSVIVSDSIQHYIIWRLTGKGYDTYFLFGNRNCSVHNYSLPSHRWPEEKKVRFLQDLYLKKP